MRTAKRLDYRRRLSERPPRLKLESFVAPTLLTGNFGFSSPITVICGPNGAGKTRLLMGIAQALACPEAGEHMPLTQGDSATVSYTFEQSQGQASFSPKTTPGLVPEHGRAYFFQPAHFATRVLEFARQKNLKEMLDAYDARTLPSEVLDRLSFLVNRKYDVVRVYELDDVKVDTVLDGDSDDEAEDGIHIAVSNFATLPYFEVTSHGRTYGSESMGMGELSMFCLWWNLDRVDAGSVVLIDEPESFASPHSQYAFVDELVIQSVKKQLSTVMVTQSQPVIDSLDLEAVRILTYDNFGTSVIASPPKATLLTTLGMSVQKVGLLLVEDHVASVVLRNALGEIALDLLQVLELSEAGGSGPLETALKMPKGTKSFGLIGVFDGDQRSRMNTANLNWPALFLPGEQCPEAVLRGLARTQSAQVATALNRTIEQLKMAESQTNGQDDHDWLATYSSALTIPSDIFVTKLSELWVKASREAFEALVSSIRRATD